MAQIGTIKPQPKGHSKTLFGECGEDSRYDLINPLQSLIQYVVSACPSVLRSDYGTENSIIAAIQIAFRYHHDDSLAREKSFLYGPSVHNIVSWAFNM